ncbi:uncharacterized protein LOC143150776 [Ptiloglossa arizonensis]|uniref:uncharacterized protein LOC143150776 n=1 Tax=Ptiloglossa arizonensis TaxID=3350558 RepID=UPI003F9FC6B8
MGARSFCLEFTAVERLTSLRIYDALELCGGIASRESEICKRTYGNVRFNECILCAALTSIYNFGLTFMSRKFRTRATSVRNDARGGIGRHLANENESTGSRYSVPEPTCDGKIRIQPNFFDVILATTKKS